MYAAANTKLPDELFADGRVRKPVVFAGNRLVIAVPKGSSVDSIHDLRREDVDLVIGDAEVPVGSYTREVLGRLGEASSRAVLANVRSEEPGVASIVGKLTQGAGDAAFVYITDVAATDGELRAVELPARLRPRVAYGAAVVEGSVHEREAQAFIDGLLRGHGLAAMRAAGFEPSP